MLHVSPRPILLVLCAADIARTFTGFGQNRYKTNMSDTWLYEYPSPLKGFENLHPLPNDLSEDGKSYVNPQTGVLSKSYSRFTSGLSTSNTRENLIAEPSLKPAP